MLEYIKSKRLTIGEVLSIAANIYKQNIKTIAFVGFLLSYHCFYLINGLFLKQLLI